VKKQQSAHDFQDSNLHRLHGLTNEVTRTYGIFHYIFKKGQKATGEVFTELLVKLITGWS